MALDFTFWLAAYGAAISTVAVGWQIYQGRQNRGKLAISCVLELNGADIPASLRLTMVNVGLQPIAITRMTVRLDRTHKDLDWGHALPLPWSLPPGDSISRGIKLKVEWRDSLNDMGAWDANGRYYRIPKASMKQVRRYYGQYYAAR